jgi:hypothetical protein
MDLHDGSECVIIIINVHLYKQIARNPIKQLKITENKKLSLYFV